MTEEQQYGTLKHDCVSDKVQPIQSSMTFLDTTRFVPKHLTEEHKLNPLNISSQVFERYHNEGEHSLNSITTGDETCIHHYDPESKHQSVQWEHSASLFVEEIQNTAGKVLLAVFWDFQSHILQHYQAREITVTSVSYCDMLRNEMKPAIRKKKKTGRLSQGVLLLHDDPCHSAACTKETLQHLKLEALDHPPYRPDLVPSDFHLS
jgi:histone-lysine N-methyltransferase SETMAR